MRRQQVGRRDIQPFGELLQHLETNGEILLIPQSREKPFTQAEPFRHGRLRVFWELERNERVEIALQDFDEGHGRPSGVILPDNCLPFNGFR